MKTMIHNAATGEIVEREMTDAEIEAQEQIMVDREMIKNYETEKAAAKALLLAKLGITAEEAALLLG
jgi:hypothetical protein